MTPAIWHKHHEVDIAEVFTELVLLKSTRKYKKAKAISTRTIKEGEVTSLTEIVDVINSTDSCKVLITGKGGMGKTTLLRYIVHKWATNTDLHNYFADKLLFMINIKDVKASASFFDKIMEQIDTKELIHTNDLLCGSVEKFLFTHANKIVILLDGYDELEKDANDPINLFKGLQLQQSTVVITSRPENIAHMVRSCDVHIEVKGFSPKSIKNYIYSHFHVINKNEVGKLLIKEFRLDSSNVLVWGCNHRDAFALCSSPLLLLKICTIWEQNKRLPNDLSGLFKALFCCIISQYIRKNEKNKTAISQLDEIPKQYKDSILLLGECMYEGLKNNNKLIVYKSVLSRMTKNEKLIELVLKLGFVYEDTPVDQSDVKERCTPPHKLIPEALSGFYLSEQIQNERLIADDYEAIRSNKYLHMTRVFTIGFLGTDAGKFLEHCLTIKDFYSIEQCLRFVKEDHKDHVLQTLDKQMSNEMKECCEQMCESFRSVLNDDETVNKSVHLFKLMRRCCDKYKNSPDKLEKKAISLVDTYSDKSLVCRRIVHILVLLQAIKIELSFKGTVYLPPLFTLDSRKTGWILPYISRFENEQIRILSAEMDKLNLKYKYTSVNLDIKSNSSFFIHFLKYANTLSKLCVQQLTANNLENLVNLLDENMTLHWKDVDFSGNNLSTISGRTLAKLLKISPDLIHIDMSHCSLSGSVVNEMMEECDRMNVVLKDNILILKGNHDFSDIDGKSLAELVRVLDQTNFKWSYYSLTADNLQKLVESIGLNRNFTVHNVNLSNINLSSISGKALACFVKIFPYLYRLDLSQCNLSGSIVNEMVEECGRMNVVLKDNMLNLKGNDLSDIDGKSLAEIVRVVNLKWSDYSLTPGNLQKLVESIGLNRNLTLRNVDLSNINLSSISGKTLACFVKICPCLYRLDLSQCNLSVSIVNEMMEECGRMNVVLKDNMLNLEGNDLSDGKSLAEIARVLNLLKVKLLNWSD
ncbi:uncharacterized protein LOC117112413 [Anneissia japonica]|uniref:uncharacterized protein LOC117112413 n=1 Tax=Anneissia japonica TaxID=1529436 RepID=UPI00142577F5|nr:uncharacterized protein LOC117112413 [Anneissia japonica]